MRLISNVALCAAVLAVAACGDNRADNGSQKAADAATVAQVLPENVSTGPILFGLGAKELEDAWIVSFAGIRLGEVDKLVFDDQGKLVQVVVELVGKEEEKVLVPVSTLFLFNAPDGKGKDLSTELNLEQLRALPAYTPAT